MVFRSFKNIGEIKLSRAAAADARETAIERRLGILGVDVGTFFESGRYLEDHNEGWLSKTGLVDTDTRKSFDQGVVQEEWLRETNKAASMAIEDSSTVFNAFILRGRRSGAVSRLLKKRYRLAQ